MLLHVYSITKMENCMYQSFRPDEIVVDRHDGVTPFHIMDGKQN